MKKIIILVMFTGLLAGCNDNTMQSEQTKAQFHTYSTATPVAADKLLFSDTSVSNTIHTVLANDLPIGTNTQTVLDGKVDNTGNETIAGIKTFSSFPVSPSSAPTTDYQIANKKYVDDNVTTIADDSILEVKLDCTNAPTDDYILSYDSGSGGFTWTVDATGSGGDQLVDGVCTTPLLINGATNVDNIWPGSDADITFSMPAATDIAAGHMTSAHVTSLESKGVGDMLLNSDQSITAAKQVADNIEFSFGTDQDVGMVYNSSNDRLEYKSDSDVVFRYIDAATGVAYVPQTATAQSIQLFEGSGDGAHSATITAQAFGADRTLTIPDQSGTIAVTTDLTAGTLDFLTSGTLHGNVGVTSDTAATVVLTTAQCRGHIRINSDDDIIDYTLPDAAAGMSVLIYSLQDQVVTIDTNGSDTITLDGTALTAGNAIDSPGAAGDFIVLLAIDTDDWITLGRSGMWVDGGAD